jgi:hypothetical protein
MLLLCARLNQKRLQCQIAGLAQHCNDRFRRAIHACTRNPQMTKVRRASLASVTGGWAEDRHRNPTASRPALEIQKICDAGKDLAAGILARPPQRR